MPKKSATQYVCMIALVAIVAAVLAGCGSTAGSDVQNPLVQGGSGASPYIVKSSDRIYSKKAPSTVSYPSGIDNDEVSETGAGPVEPCSLVSGSEAAAILGGAVQVSQEPQGPTCVYAVEGSAEQVTMVVESTRLASLRKHARKTSAVSIAGQTGWCLRYESTSVVVPLPGGRVLHVTGPCDAAASFAALAVPRVPH